MDSSDSRESINDNMADYNDSFSKGKKTTINSNSTGISSTSRVNYLKSPSKPSLTKVGSTTSVQISSQRSPTDSHGDIGSTNSTKLPVDYRMPALGSSSGSKGHLARRESSKDSAGLKSLKDKPPIPESSSYKGAGSTASSYNTKRRGTLDISVPSSARPTSSRPKNLEYSKSSTRTASTEGVEKILSNLAAATTASASLNSKTTISPSSTATATTMTAKGRRQSSASSTSLAEDIHKTDYGYLASNTNSLARSKKGSSGSGIINNTTTSFSAVGKDSFYRDFGTVGMTQRVQRKQ
jgi:hypothetical protein